MLLKFFIGTGIFFLVALCTWLILIILMQKPSAQGGMGAALGGGMAESAFGGEASNVLTRWTVYSVIAYFVLTLILSLCQIPRAHQDSQVQELKPMVVEEQNAGSLTTLPKKETSISAVAVESKETRVPDADIQATQEETVQTEETPTVEPAPQSEVVQEPTQAQA